ncbi:MAG: exo-alpha-sialidase [Isosphaeraceae bacterium]
MKSFGFILGLVAATAHADAPDKVINLDDATRARCLKVLRDGLASDEFWPSMHAAEGLSNNGQGAEVRALLEPKLPKETDDQHRCGLAREIVRSGDLAAAQVLLDVLASKNPYGHVHACESLFKVNEIGNGALLKHALAKNDSPRLAIMAAAALSRWGNPEALSLLRKYVKDQDGETAKLAAWVLARTGDQGDLPALKAGAERFEEPLTRAYFEHARAVLGDPDGLKTLIKNLSDNDAGVRTSALEFAPEARAVEGQDALIKLLDDPTLDARVRAASALLELAKPGPSPRNEVISRDVFVATPENPRYSEGSVIVLRDGRLLYVTTEFQGGGADFSKAHLVAVESADGGRTWGSSRVIQENVGKQNVMSATFRRLSSPARFDAPIGLFYLVKNSATDLDVYLRVSTDEGASFGEPVLVTDHPGYHVLNNDRVTVLSTGRLIVPVASSDDVFKKGSRFLCSCFLSDDQGATWKHSKSLIDSPKRGAMEPEVIERANGSLLMHIRTQTGQIYASESSDGGETWSEGKPWTVKAPEAPSTLRQVPSTGHWLLIWNDCFRDGQTKAQRTPQTAAISTDEGATWTRVRDLEPRDQHSYAYTSIVFHKGRALLTYYVGDPKTHRISSRFRSVPIAWFYENAR